ncbi:hypothetical protein C8R43DRAFT_983225 [Mycena crocata]|nr:hypothetical protein C8R43DRAFT_983225 [Mycena crocata]
MAIDPNAEDYELLLPSEQSGQLNKSAKHEDQLPGEGRRGDQLGWYLALAGAGFFAVVTWVIVLINDPLAVGWFALHPLLQSLSLLMITYGVMTLQPTSQSKTKAAGLTRHQYAILFIAFPAIFAGTGAVVYNKYAHGAQHFKSWHGKLGITTMAWIVIQVLLGGGSVWFGGVAFGGGAKAKAVWKYHRLSGYVLFALLMFTAHLGGAWSGWGKKYSPFGMRVIAYFLGTFAAVVGVYIRLRPSKMKFL